MMGSRKSILVMAVAMVLLFFVADSVLARGGRGGGGRGGGRGGGGRSHGKSFSRQSGGSSHSIRNSGSRSYNRGSRGGSASRGNKGGTRDRYGGGGRYDRPSTGRPGDRPGFGNNRPGDRPGRPGDRPGRPGDRPGRPGDGNYKDPYSQAYKNQKSLYNTRQQVARSHYDDRREWRKDNWYYGRGRYAGVRIYYSVPCTYTVNVINGHTYYQCGTVRYDRVYNGGQVTYIVVK